MGSIRGIEALRFLLGDERTIPIGTWFFVEAAHLSPPLPKKDTARSLIASKDSDASIVIVYPRSKSRGIGIPHLRHEGHECRCTALCPTRRHDCHVNLNGHVDPDTPITLSRALLEGRLMCSEDETSSLLVLLESDFE